MAGMSGPRNNLADVLRRRGQTAKVLPAISNLHPKTSKFKPAASTPPLRKNTSGSLPSFSTPGFKPRRDIIDLSSTETTPITVPPRTLSVKRSSSDSALSSEHSPSSKKPRKDSTASNKENIYESAPRDKGKGKAKEPTNDDDEPWKMMEVDEDPNPFARLDRDYPQHAAPTVTPPIRTLTTLTSNSKSLDVLKTLQCTDSDFKFKIMDSILEYVTMKNKNHDITLLNAINAVIENRICAIRTAITARERGEEPAAPPPPSRPPPPAAAASVSSKHFTHQVRELIPERDDDDDDDDVIIVPGSDDYLWQAVGGVPMEDVEDEFSNAIPEPVASTSTCISAIQPTTEQSSSPYYKEITRVLKSVFKLESFRGNQLEAILATMSGKDVFVLMPTGGGKSLCYQLPAVCKGSSSSGLTVVVSPLIALMNDQVNGLRNIGVDVELWNSENSSDDAYAITRRLKGGVGELPCMLYLTPEKLSESAVLKSILGRLYEMGALARFVIDEAHCISTWGRDFRDAYAKLDCLRAWYPNVPIMALTATANESVIKNIIDRLSIPNCVFLKQSFNRPNLHYDVREKKKNTILKEIAAFIKSRHADETGIIYCFARAHCEQVAQALRDEFGLRAEHYHAGMPQAEKKRTQDQWQSGEAQIIVSTIAFGMGIDKKDVRFVIHHTMPKNMDGYYQETGRAGRDGRPADCILFYQYGDAKALMEQIAKDKDDGTTPLTEEDKTRLTEEVKKVMEYCTNISRCRRVQVLRYFNEAFHESDCHKGCDVCMDDAEVTTRDVTTEAIEAIKLLKSMSGNNSMAHCKAVFVGSKKKEVMQRGHDGLPGHGKGHGLGQKGIDQLFEELVAMDVFREQAITNSGGWSNSYLQLGQRANEVLSGQKRVTIHVKAGPASAGPSKKTTKKTASKPVVRTTSKKTVVQEKKVSLFQADNDYLGSFSDDEEFDGYVPLIDDDDDEIVEAPSPKPKAWPPVRSVSERATALRPSPSIEVIDDSEGVSMSTSDRLHLDLKTLRRQIIARDELTSDDDVFDDMFLLRLSLMTPTDAPTFKELIKDHYDTDMKFVNEKWAKYGKNFLQLCISSKLAPPRLSTSVRKATNISFDSAGMHERFDYQETSTSASRPPQTFKSSKSTGAKG